MKIYSITLEVYVPDSVNPKSWNWDNLIHNWNIKDVHGIVTACERREDLEYTIPTKEYSDTTVPPISEE